MILNLQKRIYTTAPGRNANRNRDAEGYCDVNRIRRDGDVYWEEAHSGDGSHDRVADGGNF